VAPVLSVLPDADTIGLRMGIPYAHALGHRGFFHGIFFAALVSAVAAGLLFRERRGTIGLLLFLVTASHGLLDAMTDGGLGIALLAPFDDTRYFLPWRPLAVSPIGVRAFLSEWGVRVLLSEAVIVWIPLGVVWLLAVAWRRRPAS
jgi:inner membrane protein